MRKKFTYRPRCRLDRYKLQNAMDKVMKERTMAAGEPSCMHKDPKPVGPKNTEHGWVSTGENPVPWGKIVGFLSIPILWILMSTTLTVISFMEAKIEEGETWVTMIGWWYNLVSGSAGLNIIIPSIICIVLALCLIGKSFK